MLVEFAAWAGIIGLAATLVFGIREWTRRKKAGELVRVRFLVGRSLDRLPGLVEGSTDSLPLGDRVGMLRTVGPGFDMWQDLADLGLGSEGTPSDEVLLDHFTSGFEDYVSQPLREADLERSEIGNHLVVRFLRDRGVPIAELGEVIAWGEPCEGPGYSTRFIPRQPWLVMLAIEPISDTPITVTEVTGRVDGGSSGKSEVRSRIAFSPVPIDRSEAILIPLGVILPPFPSPEEEFEREWDDWMETGHYRRLGDLRVDATQSDYQPIQPIVTPDRVKFNAGDKQHSVGVHRLDPTSVLALDTFWVAGTCPHLFERSVDGTVRHVREIIPDGSDGWVEDFYLPSVDCVEIIIAELEFEVTLLQRVEQSGVNLLGPTTLRRGESVEVKVLPAEPIRSVGRYSLTHDVGATSGVLFKIAVVEEFLSRLRRGAGGRTDSVEGERVGLASVGDEAALRRAPG